MKVKLIFLASLFLSSHATFASDDCAHLIQGFLAPASTEIALTKLTPGETENAYQLIKSVFTQDDPIELKKEVMAAVGAPGSSEFLKQNYHDSFLQFASAKDSDGEILGLIGMHLDPHDADYALWVTTLAVGERARGKGIGKKLLAEVESQARLLGKTKVRLYTNNSPLFESAQHLYEKNGYFIKKTWPKDVDGQYDTYIREKSLE